MELLLRIIVPNISTEYFSGIFQDKTLKKMCWKWSTLYTCSWILNNMVLVQVSCSEPLGPDTVKSSSWLCGLDCGHWLYQSPLLFPQSHNYWPTLSVLSLALIYQFWWVIALPHEMHLGGGLEPFLVDALQVCSFPWVWVCMVLQEIFQDLGIHLGMLSQSSPLLGVCPSDYLDEYAEHLLE